MHAGRVVVQARAFRAVRVSRTSVVREEFSRTTDGEEATREGFSGVTVGLSTIELWGWLVSCSWESWFQG